MHRLSASTEFARPRKNSSRTTSSHAIPHPPPRAWRYSICTGKGAPDTRSDLWSAISSRCGQTSRERSRCHPLALSAHSPPKFGLTVPPPTRTLRQGPLFQLSPRPQQANAGELPAPFLSPTLAPRQPARTLTRPRARLRAHAHARTHARTRARARARTPTRLQTHR